jgi:RNA recognition motif-containing protein
VVVVTKLYVGNLSHSTGEKQIHELFSKAGPVKSVSLITDRGTGQSRGFAFVEMETSTDAQKAIGMLNGTVFEERPLTVSVARAREDQGNPTRFPPGPKRSGKRPRGRRY